jgi:hypothetical protein
MEIRHDFPALVEELRARIRKIEPTRIALKQTELFNPIAIATNSSPSARSGIPNVKRSAPLSMSWPMVPNKTPSTNIPRALRIDP